MENKRNFVNRFDWTLAFILFTFLVISLLAIASAQTSGQYGINYVPLQLRWYVIGAFIIGVIMFFEPDQYKKWLGICTELELLFSFAYFHAGR